MCSNHRLLVKIEIPHRTQHVVLKPSHHVVIANVYSSLSAAILNRAVHKSWKLWYVWYFSAQIFCYAWVAFLERLPWLCLMLFRQLHASRLLRVWELWAWSICCSWTLMWDSLKSCLPILAGEFTCTERVSFPEGAHCSYRLSTDQTMQTHNHLTMQTYTKHYWWGCVLTTKRYLLFHIEFCAVTRIYR